MKRILLGKPGLTIFLLIVITMFSCKKNFLDRKPQGRFSEGEIAIGALDGKVFAAYATMRGAGFNGNLYLGIHSFRADESEKGSSPGDGADHGLMYDDFQYTATNGGLQTYWSGHYALINASNQIIKDVDSIGSAADASTLINRAEAKFLRAFSYFDLVRTFGRVPKIDFVGTSADLNKPKVNNVSELFTLIDADLLEAANVLPVSWEATYTGRLTKGAALALQAKTFLWRSNWGAALTAAKAVIALNRYSLVSNYGSQFRKEGENGTESIFEIQAYYTPTNNQGIDYAMVQGVRGAGNWDLGWGWNTPTNILENEFEPGDPRKTETLLYTGQVDPLYNVMVPSGLPRAYWNKKVYTNPADRLALNNRFGPWMNHRIIRYADVLLMAAEAATEAGGTQNITDAKAWLEMVRSRARGAAAILPAVTTNDQAALRNAIRHERFVELGMEEQRFYDIVRWGIDVTVLPAAGKTAYQVKHRLLPIPQGEIDKSGGVLIQNPDY